MFTLPAAGSNSPFPVFPATYDNGVESAKGWANHPRRYNVLNPFAPSTANPGQYDRRFGAWNMERLLRFGDTNAPALVSELEQLLPKNLNDPTNAASVAASLKRRLLITTDSVDRQVPGLTPYVWHPANAPFVSPDAATAAQPAAIPFPATTATVLPPNPPGGNGEFGRDWRAAVGGVLKDIFFDEKGVQRGRADLNRSLPNYPSSSPTIRFDDSTKKNAAGTPYSDLFAAAQAARQKMADDIYRRLLAVTGVPVIGAANRANPTDAQLRPRRWLAQLAVNIVDFIDDDNISTPFNFYTAADAGVATFDVGAVSNSNPELPRYWVFGTELPRVVLN
jgi:hypothetical protein